MHTILIADDELIIRQGIKCIIDWEALGFSIVGEASNGEDALQAILSLDPDAVMLDIRMPKYTGLEVAKLARKQGYTGKIIILSGFSEFSYAKEAMRYGVEYYLTKPIDEDELYHTIEEIAHALDDSIGTHSTLEQYKERTQNLILYDLILGNISLSDEDAASLGLDADSYQVVIYEKYHHTTETTYTFSELLKVTNEDNTSYFTLRIENHEILLLKGEFIQQKFKDFLERYEREQRPQTNSPLDSLFITYGRQVTSISEISQSYQDAKTLLDRRFFCEHRQHTIGYDSLPVVPLTPSVNLDALMLKEYCEKLIDFLQTSQRNQIAETLNALEKDLYHASADIGKIKLFLTDLYLSIKERISHLYHNTSIPFPGNTEIIATINEKCYLYEIVLFFTEQFEMIVKAIGSSSSTNVMDDIIYYIKNNYMDNIKLETIAPLFGYNSSYLGKLFTKNIGIAFNTYVDQIRIERSKELLATTNLKVYEIADKVGYRNVDYFHTKFKKYVNQSPAEYRKERMQP